MKALSMTPPFGQMIRDGKKTIETRTWNTNHRGPVLFCCAKSPGSPEAGMALCVADVVNTRPMTEDDEPAACCPVYPKAVAWELANVRRVRPFPVKGQLNLFEVDDSRIKYKD